jgi:hypothetical protein
MSLNETFVADIVLLHNVKNREVIFQAANFKYATIHDCTLYVVCLKISVNGTRKQTKQNIQTN